MEENNRKINGGESLDNEEILICACHSTEHQIVIQKDDDEKVLYCSIHLSPLPWYKRIVNGVKYIFGYRSCYGDFDEFLFDKKHINKLDQMVTFLKESQND